jgi:hypothetical protein
MELFPVLVAIFLVLLVLLLLYLITSYTFFFIRKRKHVQTKSPQNQSGGHIYIPRKTEETNKKDSSITAPQSKNKITIIKSLDKNQ